MSLIHESREQRRKRDVVAGKRVFERMLRFVGDLKRRSVLVATESLASDDKGVRVQVRASRSSLVDSPFA